MIERWKSLAQPVAKDGDCRRGWGACGGWNGWIEDSSRGNPAWKASNSESRMPAFGVAERNPFELH